MDGFLAIPLSELHENQKCSRELPYLGACKALLPLLHLVKSYVRSKFFIWDRYMGYIIKWCASLLYEAPGGNLVDGLPPAASTGAGR